MNLPALEFLIPMSLAALAAIASLIFIAWNVRASLRNPRPFRRRRRHDLVERRFAERAPLAARKKVARLALVELAAFAGLMGVIFLGVMEALPLSAPAALAVVGGLVGVMLYVAFLINREITRPW